MEKHYIAVDWSQKTMAIAHFSERTGKTDTFETQSELKVLKQFLNRCKGPKVLTFEEGTQAQWLYVELRGLVDEVLVCDPYRNSLLKEGAKNDKGDANKLLQLLRAGLLKSVFHTDDSLIYMRHLVTGYGNLVKSGVQVKNQMKALLRAHVPNKDPFHKFVLEELSARVDLYELEKQTYKNEFKKLMTKNRTVRLLASVPGIGCVGAVILASRIVYAKRFLTKGHFLSYCGLVRLEKLSGGVCYGRKLSRHSRQLKNVFKTAALSIINGPECVLKNFYLNKIAQGFPEFQARHALARRVAVLTFGALKADEVFDVRKIHA